MQPALDPVANAPVPNSDQRTATSGRTLESSLLVLLCRSACHGSAQPRGVLADAGSNIVEVRMLTAGERQRLQHPVVGVPDPAQDLRV